MKKLQALGAEVTYNDPHVPQLRMHGFDMESQDLTPEYLQAQDCVLIATDHSAYDWKMIARHSMLIVDTRNALRGHDGFNIVRLSGRVGAAPVTV